MVSGYGWKAGELGSEFSGICKCPLELEKGGPPKGGCLRWLWLGEPGVRAVPLLCLPPQTCPRRASTASQQGKALLQVRYLCASPSSPKEAVSIFKNPRSLPRSASVCKGRGSPWNEWSYQTFWTTFSATEAGLRFPITHLNEEALILAWCPTWSDVSASQKVLGGANESRQACPCDLVSRASYTAALKWK